MDYELLHSFYDKSACEKKEIYPANRAIRHQHLILNSLISEDQLKFILTLVFINFSF